MTHGIMVFTEDSYGRKAIESLISALDINVKVNVRRIEICSQKMSKLVRAASKHFSKVIILVDAENRRAEEVERNIRRRHVPSWADKVRVIVVTPCLEVWACVALGLSGCHEQPADVGALRSVKEYFRRRHGINYKKKFLPCLMRDAFGGVNDLGNVKLDDSLRVFLRELGIV